MKSLIEESSSIAKAIEKGWERAGKPQTFSIKIFELPEKNFLGITTKYAKVGIFFGEEKVVNSHKKETQPNVQRLKRNDTERPEKVVNARPLKSKEARPLSAPTIKNEEKVTKPTAQPAPDSAPEIVWQENLFDSGLEWLKTTLALMQLPSTDFTHTIDKNYLYIKFSNPLLENDVKQSQLFKNLSYLLMAALRTKFKTDLKGLKILFSCE